MRILYISYTGLLEPLGRSQVLAYLEKLSVNHEISVVSFEKQTDLNHADAIQQIQKICQKFSIDWIPLRYHHRPRLLATTWDITVGLVLAVRICIRKKIQLIHARSYIPALMALIVNFFRKTPYIFDMRAFWPDEMVSAGRLKKNSLIYKLIKKIEQRCILSAAAIVVLTKAAATYLRAQPNYQAKDFSVIPTCVDLERFQPCLTKKDLTKQKNNDCLILACIGTVSSGWFFLDWLMAFYRALQQLHPNTLLRFITRDHPQSIHDAALKSGVSSDSIEIISHTHEAMRGAIQQIDVGAMFFMNDFSKLGSSPTRMGEILACGVPCVANPGIGDVAEIITSYKIGVLIGDCSHETMLLGARQLLDLLQDPLISQRCRQAAQEWFSLAQGVEIYDRIYRCYGK